MTVNPVNETPSIPASDIKILRELGVKLAEIASLPCQDSTAKLWKALNDRQRVRPMIYINELPWHELNVNNELTPLCQNPYLSGVETGLRRIIYQWNHLPGDMVVSPYISCPKVWRSTDIGMTVQENTINQDAAGGIQSHHFIPQLTEFDDLEKIKMPVVSYDQAETERRRQLLESIFDGILPVVVEGIKGIWFTPWDNLIRYVDMDSFMIDMITRPEFTDAMVSRYVDAKMHELDQMAALNLFSPGLDNTRVGSGGYAYTSDLPAEGYNPDHVRTCDLWGCGNAQIFSEISPDMHWEFSLKHEMRWLERWGLNYYGCCEQLHHKIGILKRIPNLRKISISPWCNIPVARQNGADDYILSIKPNPAIFAEDSWQPDRARQEIRQRLDEAKGCSIELIMKDVSTVRHKPHRIWEWAQLAMETVTEYGG